ncbi:unnamed protein product, partial [Closterium sp. NIES-54]
DHFLSLCPTELTVDLLVERLATAEKSILAVGFIYVPTCFLVISIPVSSHGIELVP